MTALLLKDFFTLTKQLKLFLVMILIFACIPGYSISAFAIVYSAMLPITALAYDERARWNQLAAMMPYSAKDVVLSKYLFGFLSVSCIAVLSLIGQYFIGVIRHTPFSSQGPASIFISVCVGILMLAVSLPVMFHLGVEKGRLLFFLLVAVMMFVYVMLETQSAAWFSVAAVSPLTMMAGLLLLTIAASVGSICLSVRLFQRNQR